MQTLFCSLTCWRKGHGAPRPPPPNRGGVDDGSPGALWRVMWRGGAMPHPPT
ncbi:hypothetical protein HanIR_Chr08g0376241 [Helianthus annuus]|nr:hypothetical protein HanIR_Chr08g0376241 [Helianthus annuus]